MDAKQTSSGLRVAALCAVRGVRTAGSREAKGVRPIIERATLEVVGRVAVKRLEVLAEKDEAYWSDDKAAGGTGLVAAVGGSAVLQDAWVDEIKQSPVHAVHRLRPLADDCARFHDLIRGAAPRHVGRCVEINQLAPGPVATPSERARTTWRHERAVNLISTQVGRGRPGGGPVADVDYLPRPHSVWRRPRETEVGDAVGATLYDAYGDIVDTPAEIDELRAPIA